MKKLLLIFLVLLLATGVFFKFFLPWSLKEAKVVSTKEAPSPTLGDQWRVYKNEKYRYQIAWHKDWHKQGENEPPYPPPPVGMTFSRDFGGGNICDFTISSREGNDAFSGELDLLSHDVKYASGTATIDGELAIKLTHREQPVEKYYFSHHGFSYLMGFNVLTAKEDINTCLDVFRKMIASFQFLD